MASGAGKVVEEPEEVGRETSSRSRNNLKDSSVTDDRGIYGFSDDIFIFFINAYIVLKFAHYR